MDNKALLNCVEQILAEKGGTHHVDDIAVMVADAHPTLNKELANLPARLSNCLSYDLKHKETRFSKPKNNSGGFKRGMYQLRRKRKKRFSLPISIAPFVNTQYTGRAGEHAVLSELLFWGFNVSLMAVDDGIDIVASKDNRYFHIQVKTATESEVNGNASFNYTGEFKL